MRKYLLTVTFLCMLGGFTIWSLVNPSKGYSDMENRKLQQAPKLSLHRIISGKYQDKYETYLADQMFFRDHWVSLYSNLQRASGRKEINNVYLANDDYLIEKYTEKDFDKEIQEANVKSVSNFLNVSSDVLGKGHVSCLFVPSKIDVLKNKMDFFGEEEYNGDVVVEEIRNNVRNKDRVLNLVDALTQHNDEYIYYRTDHHWTTLGAYYGFCEYQKMNHNEVPELQSYEQEVVFDDFLGTSYNKTHTFVKPDEVRIFHTDDKKISLNGNNGEFISDSFYFKDIARNGFDRYQLFFSKNTGKIEITTSAPADKTLLVIKDSYANCFVPFLANEYGKIIMIDCRYTKMKMKHIFKQYGDITDVLVLFNIEKFRQDTHLTALEVTPDDLRQTKSSKSGDKKENGPEEDIFGDLISLD